MKAGEIMSNIAIVVGVLALLSMFPEELLGGTLLAFLAIFIVFLIRASRFLRK